MDKFDKETIEQISSICHQANKAYCDTLGDDSQPNWVHAPGWQKDSARKGVELHLSGDHGPEESHKSWTKEKLDTGWVFGLKKDPAKKTHPCLVDFEKLPIEQQAKDYLFRAIVHAFKEVIEKK